MRKLAILALLVSASMSASAQLSVVVRKLTIEGAEAVPAKERQQVSRTVKGRTYQSDQLEAVAETIRLAFADFGYYKVRVDDPKIREVGPYYPRQKVDVVAHVVPGQKYSLKEISFSNNTVLPGADLRKKFDIRDGETFNRTAIGKGLEDVRRLYWEHGYINFTSVPDATVDDQARTVAILIDCDEQKQFRYGELILDGIEPYAGAGKKLLEAWEPFKGQIFNTRELEQFFKNQRTIQFSDDPGWRERDGVVDVFLSFP
jgi:outer membrane protein assembly factor BamA